MPAPHWPVTGSLVFCGRVPWTPISSCTLPSCFSELESRSASPLQVLHQHVPETSKCERTSRERFLHTVRPTCSPSTTLPGSHELATWHQTCTWTNAMLPAMSSHASSAWKPVFLWPAWHQPNHRRACSATPACQSYGWSPSLLWSILISLQPPLFLEAADHHRPKLAFWPTWSAVSSSSPCPALQGLL